MNTWLQNGRMLWEMVQRNERYSRLLHWCLYQTMWWMQKKWMDNEWLPDYTHDEGYFPLSSTLQYFLFLWNVPTPNTVATTIYFVCLMGVCVNITMGLRDKHFYILMSNQTSASVLSRLD